VVSSPHPGQPEGNAVTEACHGPDFVARRAAPTPTPGGGAAAAEVAAVAAALVEMVVGLGEARRPSEAGAAVADRARSLRHQARRLREEDASAFAGVLDALRLPRTTPDERARRRQALDRALAEAAGPPLAVANLAAAIAGLAAAAKPAALPSAVSDLAVADLLARAAGQAALESVEVNVRGVRNPEVRQGLAQRRDAARRLLVAGTPPA
jgi:formiminotetrahydrofolate cyclodeaminase